MDRHQETVTIQRNSQSCVSYWKSDFIFNDFFIIRSFFQFLFDFSILKLRENGVQPRELARVRRGRPKCDSDGKNFGSVRVNDCYAAFIILVYGFVASFAIFCIEQFLNSRFGKVLKIDACFQE